MIGFDIISFERNGWGTYDGFAFCIQLTGYVWVKWMHDSLSSIDDMNGVVNLVYI
jgi:hypothetical protein